VIAVKRNPLLAALVLCFLLFSAVAVAAAVTAYITDTGKGETSSEYGIVSVTSD
jgi:hypothetical protein